MGVMRTPTNPRFTQDDTGQWWLNYRRGGRSRCKINTCERCGDEYVVSPHAAKTQRYCGKVCSGQAKELGGPSAIRWNTGRIKRAGYVLIWMPDHHSIKGRNVTTKYVPEHRLVMEEHLGRPLLPVERVHHRNGIKDDNRPENLELWKFGHPPGQRVGEAKHCPTCTCPGHELAP